MYNRINAYRAMWVLVLFDLPTETRKDKRRYQIFRKAMLSYGFQMFQFSIYIRHCQSRESAQVHAARIKSILPPKGNIGILSITDKQFGMMELFHGKKSTEPPPTVQQLELF